MDEKKRKQADMFEPPHDNATVQRMSELWRRGTDNTLEVRHNMTISYGQLMAGSGRTYETLPDNSDKARMGNAKEEGSE